MLGFVALRTLLKEWPPFLALLNSFTPFLFVPLLLALPLALLARSRIGLVGLAIVSALFFSLYGPLFLPRFEPYATQSGDTLDVMTFNLGLYLSQPEQIVAVIASEKADIVGVQEMTPAAANQLRELYPYRVLEPGMETTGLLSQYPILRSEWFEPKRGGRAYLHAVVDWNGVELNVFVVHPLPPGLLWYKDTLLPIGLKEAGLQHEITDIVQRASVVEGPVLIMGDFNTSDQTRAYASVAQEYRDAYREAGWGFGFTFPYRLQVGDIRAPGPLVRVDYIFHSDDLFTERAKVGCGGGSDHCYLVARLTNSYASVRRRK
jgi:endonuclease/exonuclease/phosphatase (EEP) superfamily protein YafD